MTGIGLRSTHYRAFLDARPPVGFVELHSENFFGTDERGIGGQPRALLEAVRADYPISLHGIGLSLGADEALDQQDLRQLKRLVDSCEPLLVSDHLAWVGIDGVYLNDLLPLPYTEAAFAVVATKVQRVQEVLKRPLLIENPSRYLTFAQSTMTEPEFLNRLASETGCGLLLDVNNVHVSAYNLGFDARAYLRALDLPAVAELHLAGFSRCNDLLVDTHSRPVDAAVWQLYAETLALPGMQRPVPTLIEWDAELPSLSVLLAEAATARCISETVRGHCDERAA